jgi:hypothetical protein
MDRIVFEVDGISAKNTDDFWLFLDEVGKKAEENGLTEEKLNMWLNKD